MPLKTLKTNTPLRGVREAIASLDFLTYSSALETYLVDRKGYKAIDRDALTLEIITLRDKLAKLLEAKDKEFIPARKLPPLKPAVTLPPSIPGRRATYGDRKSR